MWPALGSAGQLMSNPGPAAALGAPGCPGPYRWSRLGSSLHEADLLCSLCPEWVAGGPPSALCQHVMGALPRCCWSPLSASRSTCQKGRGAVMGEGSGGEVPGLSTPPPAP